MYRKKPRMPGFQCETWIRRRAYWSESQSSRHTGAANVHESRRPYAYRSCAWDQRQGCFDWTHTSLSTHTARHNVILRLSFFCLLLPSVTPLCDSKISSRPRSGRRHWKPSSRTRRKSCRRNLFETTPSCGGQRRSRASSASSWTSTTRWWESNSLPQQSFAQHRLLTDFFSLLDVAMHDAPTVREVPVRLLSCGVLLQRLHRITAAYGRYIYCPIYFRGFRQKLIVQYLLTE